VFESVGEAITRRAPSDFDIVQRRATAVHARVKRGLLWSGNRQWGLGWCEKRTKRACSDRIYRLEGISHQHRVEFGPFANEDIAEGLILREKGGFLLGQHQQ